ncbi:MAG: HDOD domain-containing protein [Planctomycetota bacterium]
MSIAEDIKKKIKGMTLLSQSASQLLEMIGDADHTLVDVVRIVECDSELTAHVLRAVNSASFGLIAPVSTVSRAVSYLGDKMVVSLAINISAPQMFSQPLHGYESERNALWEHSLQTALAAKDIAVYARRAVNPEEAFTAGLLHDIGKSVISEYMAGSAGGIIGKMDADEAGDYMDGERLYCGIDHCEAGFDLAKHWSFPPALAETIMYHHSPEEAGEDYIHMAYVTHLADMITMMLGSGTGADCMRYGLNPDYTNYIDLGRNELETIILDVAAEFAKTSTMLSGEETLS